MNYPNLLQHEMCALRLPIRSALSLESKSVLLWNEGVATRPRWPKGAADVQEHGGREKRRTARATTRSPPDAGLGAAGARAGGAVAHHLFGAPRRRTITPTRASSRRPLPRRPAHGAAGRPSLPLRAIAEIPAIARLHPTTDASTARETCNDGACRYTPCHWAIYSSFVLAPQGPVGGSSPGHPHICRNFVEAPLLSCRHRQRAWPVRRRTPPPSPHTKRGCQIGIGPDERDAVSKWRRRDATAAVSSGGPCGILGS